MQQTEFFGNADEIAAKINDGDTVAIGGLWFIRLPMAVIYALKRRNVGNLTLVTQAGGLAVEQLIEAGMVKKVIFSFISLDLFGLAPLFRKAALGGVICEEWTALQMNTALEASRLGLSCGVLQRPLGSEFDTDSEQYRRFRAPFGETPSADLAVVAALTPDVALIHAQQADDDGNIAILGSLAIDRLLIGASKKTYVTVEEMVPRGKLGCGDPRAALIPKFLISGVCVAPGGAYPCSCLPYYATDYPHLLNIFKNFQANGRYENLLLENSDNSIKTERLGYVRNLALAKSFDISSADRQHTGNGYTTDELMVCVMAAELRDNMVCTVGSNTPLSMVAYMLAKKTHAPNMSVIPFCGLCDIPVMPVSISFAEVMSFHNSSAHWSIEDLWQWIYQKSLTAVEYGGCAQIDEYSNINNSEIRDTHGKLKLRLPGQAGLADILNLHQNAYYYITSHDKRRVVGRVSYHGGSYKFVTDEERSACGLPPGVMKIITNLCVMELDKATRRLTVTKLHPNVRREDILEHTGFDITFCDRLETTAPPTDNQLSIIRNELDPFGIRRLEFLSGDERLQFISDILETESAAHIKTASI